MLWILFLQNLLLLLPLRAEGPALACALGPVIRPAMVAVAVVGVLLVVVVVVPPVNLTVAVVVVAVVDAVEAAQVVAVVPVDQPVLGAVEAVVRAV